MRLLKALKGLTILFIFAITMIVSKWVARLFGWLRIGTVIYTKKSLHTPIVNLVHPASKRRIVLIGVIHIGEAEYFRQIQHVVTTLKDYKILFEGIGSLTDTEKRSLSGSEKEIYDNMEKA